METFRYFIVFLFVFGVHTVCKLQNLSNESYAQHLSNGDKLASKHQYKEAKNHYNLSLSLLPTTSKEFPKIKLKLWETNHKMFIFDHDSIFLVEIINAKHKTTEEFIQAHCLRAKGYFLNQEFEKGKTYLDKIQKISEKNQNSYYYLTLGAYYAYKSNMTESTKACFLALNDAVKKNDYTMMTNIYSKLSRNYLHESLYDESIKYAQKSIQIQKNNNIINNLGQNYEVAMYYFYLDSTSQDSVLYYADASFRYATLANDLITQIYQCLNLATLHAPNNKKLAYQYIAKLNSLKKEYKIPNHILSNIDLYEGVFEMENENYKTAIEIFDSLKDRFAKQSRSEEHLCYEYLSKCYLNTGQLDKALEMEKMRSFIKEKYESENAKKELLASELKHESLQKDRIILQNKITILNKELDAKKWSNLYHVKETENLLLSQNQTISNEKNKNLINQIKITEQENKIKLKEKEITILRKNKTISKTILISIILGILISLVFLYILWKKSKLLHRLESSISMASQNLLNAKKHLELLDENSSNFKTSSVKNDFHSIMDDFITFEKDIESIVENTQKYKFRIHHEIKTPIIRIQYLLGKLSTSENISNDEKETLTSIQNNIKSMKDTAEKILLLSKIQNAQLQTSEIDINQNITNIIEDIEHQHNTLIECNINSKKSIQADPLLINIVWQNMISNSIKYAHPDRKLKINIDTNNNNNKMIIDYTDNGIGINRTELNSAADTRDRIMNNNSNKIGLNIIQTIIEKHGGDFKIVDSSIHGSKFRITLP